MLKKIGIGVAIALSLTTAALLYLWHDRPDFEAAGVRYPAAITATGDAARPVAVTWLGVDTLLIDDGTTQLLTDGFFSRPPLARLFLGKISPDRAAIDRAIARFRIDRLAAVIPVHSHYDHAFDSAEVAKRTGAKLVGSPSTANLGRGAQLPEAQIVTVTDGQTLAFGHFTVTMLVSAHASSRSGPPLPGTIDVPLTPPARASAWKEGASYLILISHPQGRLAIQGSSGIKQHVTEGHAADVLFLAMGGLTLKDPEYRARYWRTYVNGLAVRRVFPIHHEDFLQPFGTVVPQPRILGDMPATIAEIGTIAHASGIAFELPRFGTPIAVFQNY
ncbi:MAG: MBL fold metallo-hydrolase [Steroidobacteraceae bacterium]